MKAELQLGQPVRPIYGIIAASGNIWTVEYQVCPRHPTARVGKILTEEPISRPCAPVIDADQEQTNRFKLRDQK